MGLWDACATAEARPLKDRSLVPLLDCSPDDGNLEGFSAVMLKLRPSTMDGRRLDGSEL